MIRLYHLSVIELVGWFLEQILIEHILCTRYCFRHEDIALFGVYNPVGADTWEISKHPIK